MGEWYTDRMAKGVTAAAGEEREGSQEVGSACSSTHKWDTDRAKVRSGVSASYLTALL